jgi:hypothetical protein
MLRIGGAAHGFFPIHGPFAAGIQRRRFDMLRIMLDQNTPAATKLRAAECVISQTAKAIELDDIESRVAALEQAGEAARQLGIATDNSP